MGGQPGSRSTATASRWQRAPAWWPSRVLLRRCSSALTAAAIATETDICEARRRLAPRIGGRSSCAVACGRSGGARQCGRLDAILRDMATRLAVRGVRYLPLGRSRPFDFFLFCVFFWPKKKKKKKKKKK